jgi:hypothetical protein
MAETIHLKDTLEDYDPDFFDLGKLEPTELRSKEDGRGGFVIEAMKPGTDEWFPIIAMRPMDSGWFGLVAMPGVELTSGRALPPVRDVEHALMILRPTLRLPTGERARLTVKQMGCLMRDTIRPLNRLACTTGSLVGFAEALCFTWAQMIAEDVKGGMIQQHVEIFTHRAMSFAKELCEQREKMERMEEMAVAAAAVAIKEIVEHAALSDEQKPTTH